jgi:DNA-binding NarL/FixJ family response regulator
MRVLILDSQPIARRGLATLCRETLAADEIVELERSGEGLNEARLVAPQLIVLDVRMAGGPPAERLCRRLREQAPEARIAILAGDADLDAVRRCFGAGADGCMLRDAPLATLAAGLRALVAGRRVIDPRIAQLMASEQVRALRGERAAVRLTRREREVLALLVEGCSNRHIAERLLIAETTVKTYVAGLMRKLGASSRLQAVARAAEHGVL